APAACRGDAAVYAARVDEDAGAERGPPPRSRGHESPWTGGDAVASVPLMAEGESGARTRPELFRLTTPARAAGWAGKLGPAGLAEVLRPLPPGGAGAS